MKKLIAIIASVSILAASSVVMVSADEANESPVATPVPTVEPVKGGSSKPNGKGGAGLKSDEATVSVVTDKENGETETTDKTDTTDVTDKPLSENDKQDVQDVLGEDKKDNVEYSTVDVQPTNPDETTPADSKVVVTVPTELSPDDNYTVVVNYGNGWEVVDPSNVVMNPDGTASVTLDGYGEVSFWVDSNVADQAVAPVVTEVSSTYTSSNGSVSEVPAKAISAQNAPSKATDYTVVDDVDYTVVSPQTGYVDWVAPF